MKLRDTLKTVETFHNTGGWKETCKVLMMIVHMAESTVFTQTELFGEVL